MPISADQFTYILKRIKRGENEQDQRVVDYAIMKEMGWNEQELGDTPEYVVQSTLFISSILNQAPAQDGGTED